MTNITLKGRDKTTQLTVLMLWLLLGVFVVYPLARLLAMTFWADGGFTLANLKPFISSWYDRQAAVNSILLGCVVGAAGTVLGFIFAFAVTRLAMPGWLKLVIGGVTILPLISPPFTSSIALTLSLGPNGILLQFFGLDNFNFYGFWGTFISETLTYFPVAFMTLSTILARIDPNLEDAAYSLGASSFCSCSPAHLRTLQRRRFWEATPSRCFPRRPICRSRGCMTLRGAQRSPLCSSFRLWWSTACSTTGSAARAT